jgi:nicotinate-nucleotide adenylyltransferase
MSALVTTVGLSPTSLPELPYVGNRVVRVGIMGGTFDPIHNGHLVAAEVAMGEVGLDVVLFMPAGSPAFKQDRHVSDPEDRYAMTLLATSDNPQFLTSRFEIARPGITYTAETLGQLHEHYGDACHLYFISGADAIASILTWKDADKLASLATFVGATRPGYDLESAQRGIEESGLDFDVRYLEIPALSISSSYLRERVSQGKSVRYLTPDAVVGYIEKRGLYRS